MAEPGEERLCPSCRFRNRPGAERCLVCKAELPEVPKAPIAWACCDPLPPIALTPGKRVVVGRQADCDLVLPHGEVSRNHAVLRVVAEEVVLYDQGSANGCYLNGARVSSSVCKAGDLIKIGPFEIEIRATPESRSSDGADPKAQEATRCTTEGPRVSMTGSLSEVPLVEILQQVEFHARTCTVAIAAGDRTGEIVFANGRPQRATCGALAGSEAVRALLTVREGRFVLTTEVAPGEATMDTTVTALLLDASREADEGSAERG